MKISQKSKVKSPKFLNEYNPLSVSEELKEAWNRRGKYNKTLTNKKK